MVQLYVSLLEAEESKVDKEKVAEEAKEEPTNEVQVKVEEEVVEDEAKEMVANVDDETTKGDQEWSND